MTILTSKNQTKAKLNLISFHKIYVARETPSRNHQRDWRRQGCHQHLDVEGKTNRSNRVFEAHRNCYENSFGIELLKH